MYSKTLFVSALLALSVVSAAPVPAEKRCLGSCNTKNDNSVHTDTTTNTNASTTSSNQQTTTNSGNQQTTGNNGGGQDFSGMNFGSLSMGCKRAFLEGRADNKRVHQNKVHGQQKPKPAPHTNVKVANTNTNVSNQSKTNTQNSNNNINKTSNTTVNKQKTNNADMSGNQGVMMGNGMVCRREFIELEMERRELDTGASVLAAMGGLTARDLSDDMEMLATRDLGRMAETLGVRAVGHEEDDDAFTHYKRDLGTECATEECAMMKREVDEMLRQHARSLGFWVEDSE